MKRSSSQELERFGLYWGCISRILTSEVGTKGIFMIGEQFASFASV